MNVELWMWLAVFGGILLMLLIDLVAHRKAHEISLREAAGWSVFWVTIGLGFGVIVWATAGAEFGQQYFAGFLIEKSLAVDNVFIWAIIFASFGVPRKYQHRVLFLGVLGALVFRGIFIALGAVILEQFAWVFYLFAAFLIFTGIQMLRTRNQHSSPADSRFFRWFSRVVPSTDTYYGQRLLVRKGGLLLATPLLSALVLIEFTDIVFALDSIPAIFAVTAEPFLVFTANAFAILGLRAMYFLLADLMNRFVYLKIGLAAVLIWVGAKMALHDVWKMPTWLSLGGIIVILAVAIIASFAVTRRLGVQDAEPDHTPTVREASAEEIAELDSIFSRSERM
jgi:tellurite resistance protein TerC